MLDGQNEIACLDILTKCIKLRSQETLKSSQLKNVFFFFCILLRPLLVMHTQNFDVFGQVIMT